MKLLQEFSGSPYAPPGKVNIVTKHWRGGLQEDFLDLSMPSDEKPVLVLLRKVDNGIVVWEHPRRKKTNPSRS